MVTYFDDLANDEKLRKPRVFYGVEGYFRGYNSVDADIVRLLSWFKDGKFGKDHFIDSFLFTKKYEDEEKVENSQQNTFRMGVIVTYEHI